MKSNSDSYEFTDPISTSKDKLPVEVGILTLVSVISRRFLTILLVVIPTFMLLTVVWWLSKVWLLSDYAQLFSALLLGLISIIWLLFAISLIRKKASVFDKFLKRLVDVSLSFMSLILLSPLMLLISVLIIIESKGPIFFVQERIGKDGKPFRMFKFRTMKINEDPLQGASPEIRGLIHDTRLTRIGAFLRKFSLDELPQLFNVVKGEMSLVGPRPPSPFELELFGDTYIDILKTTPPGLTGLWQVSKQHSEGDDRARLELDEYYARNWSLWLDVIIMLKTVTRTLSSAGAY